MTQILTLRSAFAAGLVIMSSTPWVPETPVGSAEAAAPRLALSVELDTSEYAIGQPVLALISVKNDGDDTFRDLTTLDPGAGFLRIRLLRGGIALPWTGHHDDIAFGGEGISLRPGEEVCETTDLLSWFGSAQRIEIPGHGEFPRVGLGAGEYSVVAELSARTGVARSLPQVEVQSNTIAFSVISTIEKADEEWRILEAIDRLTRDGTGPTMTAGERKQLGLSSLGSRYFYYLLQWLRLSEADLPAKGLIGSMRSKGRTPVFMAAAVDSRCVIQELGDAEKKHWIENLRSTTAEPEVRRVLSSWLIKLREHSFYPSFGR